VTTGLFTHEHCTRHDMGDWHPESPARLAAIMDYLKASGLLSELEEHEAVHVSREALARAHPESYLAALDKLHPPEGLSWADPDTALNIYTLDAAARAAGGAVAAVKAVLAGSLANAFCAVRPPGHHAEPARGMGFCLLNNAAVGARYAQRLGYARVMVADFDVHHGNGTQAAFYEDDSVFYFSTHEYPHYPGTGAAGERGVGRGAGFTRNVPLSAGAGDAALRQAWEETFRADAGAFSPDCCIVSAGYDLHEGDPLADLAVSDEGVRGIVRSILESCAGIPVVFALEGGYHLATLARCVGLTVEELLR